MLIKNTELYAMGPLLGDLEALDVPARTGVHVARLVKKLGGAIAELDAARNKIINKYGSRGPDGIMRLALANNSAGLEPSPEWEKGLAEWNDLMDDQTDIEVTSVVLPADARVSVKVLRVFDAFVEVRVEP